MAEPFICGYLNLDSTPPFTYSDVERPTPGGGVPSMYAYPGEGTGMTNGMKSKMGLGKTLWFIACDDPTTPTVMYLGRETRNLDDTVSLAWKQIPLIAETYVSHPNQVTIDQWGDVYFTSGTLAVAQANYYVAKVTSSVINPCVDDPDDWTITWHPNAVGGAGDPTSTGTYGVSLSKNHATLVTFVSATGGDPSHSDFLAVLSTATMIEVTQNTLNGHQGAPYPYNIETDVSGGGNDNWAFLLAYNNPNPGQEQCIVGINMTNPAAAFVNNAIQAQTERTVSIKTTGVVVTGDPTQLNETVYPVLGAGSLGPGVPNAVGAPVTMNHSDLVRADPAPLIDTRYWAHGSLLGITGQVIEVGAIQNTRVTTADYKYFSVACEREANT